MLVHICCAVDSHYFLQKLQKDYPRETLVGFFYDPNIHPYSEYYLRLLEVRRSCDLLGIELIEGDYDMAGWLEAVRGLESEPEKGARCSVCFDHRFEVSAQKAVELGEKVFTSTLLTSPKKSIRQLKASGEALGRKYGLEFLAPDYRQASGTQEQNKIAKDSRLYRQDYCGCIYALGMQRENQNRLADELMSPLSGQIQPESIEERIRLYEDRLALEEAGKQYRIVKNRFLNWRLKSASLVSKNKILPAHVLPYSMIKKGYTRGKIVLEIDGLHYLNRDELKIITLKKYNQIAATDYKSAAELIYDPPTFDLEIRIREKLTGSAYDLSTILVTDKIPDGKIEFRIDSTVYEDVREVLIEIS